MKLLQLAVRFSALLGWLPNAHAQSLGTNAVNQAVVQAPDSLYELGFGAGLYYLPDYPAANHGRVRTIALPYGIYRGRTFRADQDGGVRTSIFRKEGYELDFSFAGSFPASSAANEARRGMSNLDWLFETGPQFKIVFWKPGDRNRFELRFPLRGAFSSNLSNLVDRGFVFNPEALYQIRNTPYRGANFQIRLGAYFGSRRLTGYFYDVDDKYVTPERPGYRAQGGYVGATAAIVQAFPIQRQIFYLFYSFSNYQGSTNAGSPLYKNSQNQAVGLGLLWTFYQSSEKVTTGNIPYIDPNAVQKTTMN